MANLTQVELPNGTTYDIQDATKSGIYTVIGTQTEATASWTGELHGVSALYDGLTINYYLPYAGVASTNVTLNLTLDSGSTTGAKNCYINTSRLTTHYGAGRTIVMTYYSAGSISITGTATTDDRWICDAYYDTNSDTKVRQSLLTNNTNRPLLLCYNLNTSTTSNVDNIVYRANNMYGNPSTGTIYSTNISVAPPADNATFPDGGYVAHDVRNVSTVPTTTGVNFIMTNEGTGISSSWYSGIYCKSSGGEYGAWELVGCALNADNRTKPFYVRNSNKTSAWGDWRKLYDSANPPTASSSTTGITVSDHTTGSVTGVQSSTTTASKVTLGTAFTVPNVTAAGSGSFTSGAFSGGSGSFSATVTNGVLSFSHTHTAATHGADSHTHTAPTLGTAFTIPNVTAATDVTVPIKNTSATTVVTSKTHTVNDSGHTHTLS